MSAYENLFNLDFYKVSLPLGIVKIELALSENDYEKALSIYKEIESKMSEFKEEKNYFDGEVQRILLKVLKARIDFYFEKISKLEFKNIVRKSYDEYRSFLTSTQERV